MINIPFTKFGFDEHRGEPLCRTHENPELWFPETGASPKEAIAICQQCPFVVECLEQALHTKVVGVWGATTANQRRSMRRELRRDQHERSA